MMKKTNTKNSEKKTYSELIKIPTFEERYRYLRIPGNVGIETFGFERYLNQAFYKSEEWLKVRREVILRDEGCDLSDPTHPINGRIIIHHLNPITEDDIKYHNEDIINPEYLVCVSHKTHNAIHYGSEDMLDTGFVERRPNDTAPWKHRRT